MPIFTFLLFCFVIKFHFVATTSCCQMRPLNVMFREVIGPPGSNKRCGTSKTVCAAAELARLPHPIKNACHVWVECVCFLVPAGPPGSSEGSTSMSFDKNASHPRARTHSQERCDSPELPLLGAHHPPTPEYLESASVHWLRLMLGVTGLVVKFSFLPNDSHSTPGYVFSCGILCLFLFHPPLLLLLAVSIVTSLRQHLHTREHLVSVPSPCSLCNEVSE